MSKHFHSEQRASGQDGCIAESEPENAQLREVNRLGVLSAAAILLAWEES